MHINGLQCKLIKKAGKKAEIEIDGQNVTISSEFLPLNTSVGQSFCIYLLNEKDAKMKEKDLAEAILEEILNGK